MAERGSERPAPIGAGEVAPLPTYPLREEIAHAVTHGIGIVLAITGLTVLVALAFRHGDTWRVTTCAVYGTTLILLYVASTLYHSIPSARAKRVLRILDHCAIYLLIAGTYTPFTLVNLRGPWGWGLFGFVWALAVAGIVFKIVATGRLRVLSVMVYLMLGWCIVVALGPLRQVVPERGMVLLVAGGVAYTLGTIFFGLKKLPYHHAIWHLFVLGGSVLHFFAVLTSVIPSTP
jgi:hemolysin III